MSNVSAIAKTLGQMLALWKSFIDTRESAYKRKMDKRNRKAIDKAELIIARINELKIDDALLKRRIKIFFRYNN